MKKILLTLAATLLTGAMAAAQSQPASATKSNDPNATQVARTDVPADRTDHNNYSWIGLLGLLGLAGLAKRREGVRSYDADKNRDLGRGRTEHVVRDRDDIRRAG